MHDSSSASRCPFAPAEESKRSLAPRSPESGSPPAGAREADRGAAVRWGLATAGFVCVALGGLGTIVPGLPTTIFLIIASWCFTRSCPWLDERMRASRIFAPYVRFLDPDVPMPARTRGLVVGLIVLFAGGSVIWLAMTEHPAAAAITVLFGVLGIGCVMLWRRPSSETATADVDAG